MAASTITRATWTDGAAGTVVNNAKKNSDIYDPIDQMFAGSGSYATFVFGGAVGSDGQPRASAYNSATQTLTTAVATTLTFDSEDFDVGTMHSTVSNTSRVTVPTSQGGLYLIIGGTTFAANATGYRELDLKKNGTTTMTSVVNPSNSGATVTAIQVMTVLVLAAADYIELIGTQTSGGNLAAGSASRNAASFLQLVRLW
jgi:hypothetical protein